LLCWLGTAGEGVECLVDVAELPLLAAEEGIADKAVAVDGIEGGTLAERAQARFDLVRAVDVEIWVGEEREGDLVCRREFAGLVEAPGRKCKQLDAFASDVSVPLAQLREMPAAERSAEGAHEDEDDLFVAAEVAQPYGAPAGAGKAEVGCLRA
jgi:hypothetical protein